MVKIDQWMSQYVKTVTEVFGNRVVFIGLQGSYGRGEATANSDIDVVCILDHLQMEDLAAYDQAVEKLPHRELLCGFLSGWEELVHWESADLFQFYYDTTPICGSIDCLLETIDRQAVRRSIHIGACNLYHMCVHNILHERDGELVKALYKTAAFIIRATCFEKTGKYCRKKSDLAEIACPQEREILEVGTALKEGLDADWMQCSQQILTWSSQLITQYA